MAAVAAMHSCWRTRQSENVFAVCHRNRFTIHHQYIPVGLSIGDRYLRKDVVATEEAGGSIILMQRRNLAREYVDS